MSSMYSALGIFAVAASLFTFSLGAQGAPKPPEAAKPAEKVVPKKKPEKGKKEEVVEPAAEAPKDTSWKSRYVPAIGFLGNVGLPLSGINEYVGPGFGGELFGSLDVGHW